MPLQAASPVAIVLGSLVDALTADSALQAILSDPGVYSGRAPNGSILPYIIAGDMATDDLPSFSGNIARGSIRLSLWAKDLARVLEMYGRLGQLLDGQRLNLGASWLQLAGNVGLTATIVDPDATAGVQGVVSYEWTAQLVA